ERAARSARRRSEIELAEAADRLARLTEAERRIRHRLASARGELLAAQGPDPIDTPEPAIPTDETVAPEPELAPAPAPAPEPEPEAEAEAEPEPEPEPADGPLIDLTGTAEPAAPSPAVADADDEDELLERMVRDAVGRAVRQARGNDDPGA
ncbi:MAG TPA: hypothetical protein VK866_10345, partial [Acidimicrobiales bacterium]|nr:hypothetical protein [Acidimicrobiales bacterium]